MTRFIFLRNIIIVPQLIIYFIETVRPPKLIKITKISKYSENIHDVVMENPEPNKCRHH